MKRQDRDIPIATMLGRKGGKRQYWPPNTGQIKPQLYDQYATAFKLKRFGLGGSDHLEAACPHHSCESVIQESFPASPELVKEMLSH